jgi:hypothetical protein
VARYRILTWRGIPAQLKVYRDDGRPTSVELDTWFVSEIDRVAMRDRLVGSDEYLAQFEWSAESERPGSAEDVARELVAELEAEWLPKRRTG